MRGCREAGGRERRRPASPRHEPEFWALGKGPWGGMVAYEMAQQLVRQDENVALLTFSGNPQSKNWRKSFEPERMKHSASTSDRLA